MPYNSRLSNLAEIKKTFLNGGYYRVDVDSKLSVLSTNTLYFNSKNDDSNQGSEADDQLSWLKSQLSNAESGRKFIITNHIYAGAKYDSKSKDLFKSDYNTQYFDLLLKYADRIVIEVSSHDHFADVRYHSDSSSGSDKSFFHNTLISPGISPVKKQNPGYAVFNIDSSSMIPENLKLVFLPIE